jgi:hypothetical protein
LAIAEPGSLRVTLSKGYCLILNFREFQLSPDDLREGSEIDVERLQNTFSQLGAVVRTQSDLTSDQVKKEVRALKRLDWTKYDHLVVAIMSHGAEGTFMTSDSKLPAEYFKVEDFTNALSECHGLAGKPKIFVINTCRGNVDNPGIFFSSNFNKRVMLK